MDKHSCVLSIDIVLVVMEIIQLDNNDSARDTTSWMVCFLLKTIPPELGGSVDIMVASEGMNLYCDLWQN